MRHAYKPKFTTSNSVSVDVGWVTTRLSLSAVGDISY